MDSPMTTPPKRERLADQLYGQLMQAIVAGHYRKGEKLPSEKKICEIYEVSRPVVREALMRLQADDIIFSRQGSGSFVQRTPPAGLIQYASVSDLSQLLKSYEVRIAVESEACALAALRREPVHLEAMSVYLSELQNALSEHRVDRDADFNFHLEIARATGNDMFVGMLKSIHMDVDKAMNMALHITSGASAERASRVMAEHRMIFEAIERRDPEEARLALRHHINRVKQRVTDDLQDR